MRLLFFGSSYPPTPHGVSRYFQNLSRALVMRGHSVTVVTSKASGHPDREEREGVRVLRICGAEEMRSVTAAESVIRLAKEESVEAIQGVEYLGECAPMLARTDRPPVCIKVVSSISLRALRRSLAQYPWQKPMIAVACLRAWRQWRAELISMRRADLLFVATHRVFHELERQGMSLPSARAVIPNPVAIPPEWKNAESSRPSILYVGRLDIGKGAGYLPDILKSVAAKVKDVELVVAGADCYARGIGSLKEWLSRRFATLLGQVTFTDELSYAQLDECYRRAWVVIVPSRWDSCSNVTLEAMARAKPVVCSPHGGMAELVAGTDAPIADPAGPEFADAVVALLSDSSYRARLGLCLRQQAAANNSLDRAADLYVRFVSAHLGNMQFGTRSEDSSPPL